MNKRIGILILCVGFIGILLSGCNTELKAKPINLNYQSAESKKTEPNTFWGGDKDLKKVFERYWSFRFDRSTPIKEQFLMEAPYFQEMVDESFYRVYMRSGTEVNLDNFQVQKLVKKTPNFYAVECLIYVKMPDGEKRDTFLTDYWVKVNGKWYHVIDDKLFFNL